MAEQNLQNEPEGFPSRHYYFEDRELLIPGSEIVSQEIGAEMNKFVKKNGNIIYVKNDKWDYVVIEW